MIHLPGQPPGGVWAGRMLSGLVTLFLLLDCSCMKIAKARAAVDGTVLVGYPEHRAVQAAILMTGYLGGATSGGAGMARTLPAR